MRDLIAKRAFQSRVSMVVVDEVHLIPIWGGSSDGPNRAFRTAYNAIGTLKSRLRSSTVFLGLSATLMPGKHTNIVKERLGFDGPKFSFIQRDCERTNLHITVRRIEHSYTQDTFADLDWLVPGQLSYPANIPKTIIYIDSIMRGHTLVTYLQSLLPPTLRSNACRIIRHLYAGSCSQCKDEASHDFLATGPDSVLRIIVATDAFGCGVDIPDVTRIINLGSPRNLCALCQRFGRAARHLVLGFCYVYVNPKLWDTVLKNLGTVDNHSITQHDGVAEEEAEGVGDNPAANATTCCPYFKQVLESHLRGQCINHRINVLFNNPLEGKPNPCLRCSGCVEDKIPSPRSGKVPNKSNQVNIAESEGSQVVDPDPLAIPHCVLSELDQPSKKTLQTVQTSITNAAQDVWLTVPAHKSTYQMGGFDAFLPLAKSSLLSNRLLDLQTPELVRRALGYDWRFWDTHGEQLAAKVQGIRTSLIADLQSSYQAKKLKCRVKRSENNTLEMGIDQEDDLGFESEELEASQPYRAGSESKLAVFSVPQSILSKKHRIRLDNGKSSKR